MKALLWSMEYVLKTMHFENSHFSDTVDQSEQSIVTVDQSELSIESAKCIVFSTCFYRQYPTSKRILDKSVPISCPERDQILKVSMSKLPICAAHWLQQVS